MQIDRTTIRGASTGDVSIRTAVASSRVKSSSEEGELSATDSGDTVLTATSDLVQAVLHSQDKAAQARVERLRQVYESGNYTAKTHEVAHAILAGVLCGY